MEFIQEEASPVLEKIIFDGFKEHAIEKTGQDGFGRSIAFAVLKRGEYVGAVVVRAFWGALHVKNMWVHKDSRGKGVGRYLLNQALAYGEKEKHPFAFVETMSFQALEFYQKMGFVLEYTRGGYAQNISFHYLRKDLIQGP